MQRVISSILVGLIIGWGYSPRVLAGEYPDEVEVESNEHAEDSKEEEKGTESDDAAAEEEADSSEEASEEKQKQRKTYEVVPKQLRIEESVSGSFISTESTEVALRPEEWSSFKIVEIVDHGAKVEKGETLIKFDDEDLENALAELEIELHLGELNLRRAEEQLPQKEKTLDRELSQAKELLRRVEQDLKRYKENERDQALEMAEWNLKMAEFNLDYYKDELEQLEKMYEADDLTEETEEIVLRRQRFYVDYYSFNLERSKYNHERITSVMIPRQDHDFEETLKQAQERLDRAETASELDLKIARYDLEKQKKSRQQSLDKHVKLLADKSLLTIESPAAGIVYYGECRDGKWSKLNDLRNRLQTGNTAQKDSVLMTVVDPDALSLVLQFDEKYLISLKQDEKIEVRPSVEGAEKLEGSIASVSTFPVSDGKFEARIEFSDELPDWLVPGVSADATVVAYEQQEALLIPAEAVQQEKGTDKEYVWLVSEGEVEKTSVESGKKKDGLVEITSGLSAGDVISLEDEEAKAEEAEE